MRKSYLRVIVVALLVLGAGGLACARITLPAGPPVGPVPGPAIAPPLAPHRPAGEGDCLACHATDERFVAALQADHPVPLPPGFEGTPRQACQLCHRMEGGHAMGSAMPHPAEGMKECLTCHGSGMAGVAQIPPDHSHYSVSQCAVCHTPLATPGPATLP